MYHRLLHVAFCVTLTLAVGRELRADRLPGTQPLLRVRIEYQVQVSGGRQVHQDFFVDVVPADRSGLAVGRVTDGHNNLGFWRTEAATGRSTPAQLIALREALAEAQVGVQPGGCYLSTVIPASGTYEITWYGRSLRQNSLRFDFGNPFTTNPPCPKELQPVLDAIPTFFSQVLQLQFESFFLAPG